jgi:hypothetical protein
MSLTPLLAGALAPAAALDPTYGWDLDLSAGDVTFTPGGTVQIVTGQALVAQRVYLCCVPPPGRVLCEPQLGAGLGAAVGYPLHDQAQAQLAQAIATQAGADPAIAHVDDVLVEQDSPGSPNLRVGVLANSINSTPLRLRFGTALGVGSAALALEHGGGAGTLIGGT